MFFTKEGAEWDDLGIGRLKLSQSSSRTRSLSNGRHVRRKSFWRMAIWPKISRRNEPWRYWRRYIIYTIHSFFRKFICLPGPFLQAESGYCPGGSLDFGFLFFYITGLRNWRREISTCSIYIVAINKGFFRARKDFTRLIGTMVNWTNIKRATIFRRREWLPLF